MPVYNAERYVSAAVESILAQTLGDFDFLIVNDGSSDGSLDILRKYERQDSRIRVISRPNTGYLVALNEMLALARGEFVARMDSDDVAIPDRFEKQTAFLRENIGYVAVGSRVMLIDPDGCDLREENAEVDHEGIDACHIETSCSGSVICHPAVMIRTESVRRIGGYRQEMYLAEDLDLFLRLAEAGKVANHPEVLLKYRMHESKISQQRRREQLAAASKAVAEARARRGLPPVKPENSGYAEDTVTIPSGPALRRIWAWWALQSGHVGTARKHAMAALRHKPFDVNSWRLMACCMRGW